MNAPESKPLITLKSVKISKHMSRETPCYSATVYIDGERWAYTENDGGGGCDMIDPFNGGGWNEVKRVDKWVARTFPKIVFEDTPVDRSLECVLHELIQDWHHIQRMRKEFKTMIVAFEPGTSNELNCMALPSEANIAAFKARHPHLVVLNEMEPEEAMQFVIEHMG
jgi:hypothetical protein